MIAAISSYLPERALGNEELERLFPDWPAERIFEKTGIRTRRIAAPNETASDLAFHAARTLLDKIGNPPIDYLLFSTQTPDYLLPASACLLQERLGLSDAAGAIDFNIGCSGFIHGLALAHGLIHSGQAARVLLLTADTYSKLMDPLDKSARTIFGDGAAATLLSSDSPHRLHSFVFGTDGSGASRLIAKHGGRLSMDGPEVFNFTLQRIPGLIEKILAKAAIPLKEIDLFVFHQANAFMLDHLRRKLGIPAEKFVLNLEHCGNTVSASIPMALETALQGGKVRAPCRLLLAGFGVGFSWAGCILEWN